MTLVDTLNAYTLARRVRASGTGLDSSKLRSSSTRQAQEEGVVPVEKYHRPIVFLTSVEVFDELLDELERHAQMLRELPLVASLLTAAFKLGITPDQAVHALVQAVDGGATLNVTALAGLVEDATDNLEVAAFARERLSAPPEADTSLEDYAAELGVDLEVKNAVITALIEIERDLEFERLPRTHPRTVSLGRFARSGPNPRFHPYGPVTDSGIPSLEFAPNPHRRGRGRSCCRIAPGGRPEHIT